MSKKPIASDKKRARDIRNGILIAHCVISWVVVLGCRLKWWTVTAFGESWDFFGTDPKAYQSGYIALAAIVAFFFTSYDLVTQSDIQWPPLLASAFALGCAAEVTWRLYAHEQAIYDQTISFDMARKRMKEAETAPVASGGVAPVGSAAAGKDDELPRIKMATGLFLALYGTLCMVLLSSYLTFFAGRQAET